MVNLELSQIKSVRGLTISKRRVDGRNLIGHVVSFHRGGGHKRRFRIVDFIRVHDNVPAIVRGFEFDPNRNASLALLCYWNEMLSYIIARKGLKIGPVVFAKMDGGREILEVGNTTKLWGFPRGMRVHNIELYPGRGRKLIRSRGRSAQILRRYNFDYVVVKLRTGEQRLIPANCKATFGIPIQYFRNRGREKIGSAGRQRWFGKRPIVRGVAMNPVDHPHGGGGGRLDRTPWGLLTKGPRTASLLNKHMILRTRRLGQRVKKNSKF